MPNLRPIILVTGALIAILGMTMLIPMLADFFSKDPADQRNWTAFGASAVMSIFIGGGMVAASWGEINEITVRQGFLLTATSWVGLVIFAALPLRLGGVRALASAALALPLRPGSAAWPSPLPASTRPSFIPAPPLLPRGA